MKNIFVEVLVITTHPHQDAKCSFDEFEDDVKNRRVVVRKKNNSGELVKAIYPYENIIQIVFLQGGDKT